MSFLFRPLSRTTISRSNFGHVKMGDATALSFFRAGLVKQYDEDFSFGIVDYDACGEILDIIGNGLFRAKENDSPFPINHYVNVWALAYYANKILGAWPSMPVEDKRNGSIVVQPLFNASYNLDRNFTIQFAEQLVTELMKTGREVVIVGAWGGNLFNKFPDCRLVLNDLQATVKEIRECYAFIGGDTGLSHLCGALESDCKIVSIYGNESQKRVKSSKNDIGRYVTGECPDFGYAPLVRPSHPYLYKEFRDVVLNEIVQFCK